jgi:flagellum-specific peptidoglycan hydrolase FlgJ
MWKVIIVPLLIYLMYVYYVDNWSTKSDKYLLTSAQYFPSEEIQNYAKKYAYLAISEMEKWNIPASITLAQAVLESNCGKSTLAIKGNNHFGIKSSKIWDNAARICLYSNEWLHQQSKMIRMLSCFEKFDTIEESFEAHSKFLRNRPHYADLFELPPFNYKSWSEGLQKAGYATDPNYANKLQNIITRYHLDDYDRLRN